LDIEGDYMADIDYEGLALLSPSERSVVLAKIRSEESKKQKWSIIMDKFQKGILRNKKGKLVMVLYDLRVVLKNAVEDFSDSNVDSMLVSLALKSSGTRVKKIELINAKIDNLSESQLLKLMKMYNIEG
jgi:hypothetical protein